MRKKCIKCSKCGGGGGCCGDDYNSDNSGNCKHLGKNGCKTKALTCKLWLCAAWNKKCPEKEVEKTKKNKRYQEIYTFVIMAEIWGFRETYQDYIKRIKIEEKKIEEKKKVLKEFKFKTTI